MVSPLHAKLGRDLLRLKGQVLTIVLVVMSGVACWVGLRSTAESLLHAREAYYGEQRFGDVFADCERAPMSTARRIGQIDGVRAVAATIEVPIQLLVSSTPRPVGSLVGIPPPDMISADVPRLLSGRFAATTARDEAVVLASFAKAHGLSQGDELEMVVGGRIVRVRIVGIAIAPNYLFAVAPGDISADERGFGVVWMNIDTVGELTDRRGAFNHLSVLLSQDASEARVRAEIDLLLAPWGSRGARGRAEQPSNRVLEQELGQLKQMALVAPAIFLGVAAFLLNAVLARLVMLERPEIAALRALGYGGVEVARHYLELVLLIAGAGCLLGVGAGAWIGTWVTSLYARYFHFPDPPFRLDAFTVIVGVAISVAAAFLGAVWAAWRIIRLSPADAMRPAAPSTYRRGWLDRRLGSLLSPASRMAMRSTLRRPGKLALSTVALSSAIAVGVIGRFNADVLGEFLTLQFSGVMREDVAVTFAHSVTRGDLDSIAAMPGVRCVEPLGVTAIELSNGHVRRERALVAHPDNSELRLVLDRYGAPVRLPAGAIAIDDYTARVLRVEEGDFVSLRTLEGRRVAHRVRVGRVFDAMTALEAHASLSDQRELTGDAGVSQALVMVAPHALVGLRRRLEALPAVYAINERRTAIARFQAVTGESQTTMTLILTFFATVIAIGVVYNDARITLSTQERELASLRVLGFTQWEVSSILFGQLGLPVLLSTLPGILLGHWLATLMASTVDPELYRFPVVVRPWTYAMSIGVVVSAALVSALLVRRKVRRLDLIGALKTRE